MVATRRPVPANSDITAIVEVARAERENLACQINRGPVTSAASPRTDATKISVMVENLKATRRTTQPT